MPLPKLQSSDIRSMLDQDQLDQLVAIESQLLDAKLSAHSANKKSSVITLRRTIARMLTQARQKAT